MRIPADFELPPIEVNKLTIWIVKDGFKAKLARPFHPIDNAALDQTLAALLLGGVLTQAEHDQITEEISLSNMLSRRAAYRPAI